MTFDYLSAHTPTILASATSCHCHMTDGLPCGSISGLQKKVSGSLNPWWGSGLDFINVFNS